MTKAPELDDWIIKLVGKAAGMFFLDGWTIKVFPKGHPSQPEGHESADGLTKLISQYLDAVMYFDPLLEPDEYGFEVGLHEVLHVVFNELREATHQIANATPDADRFMELYEFAEERAITTLARGMVRQFQIAAWLDKTEVVREGQGDEPCQSTP